MAPPAFSGSSGDPRPWIRTKSAVTSGTIPLAFVSPAAAVGEAATHTPRTPPDGKTGTSVPPGGPLYLPRSTTDF